MVAVVMDDISEVLAVEVVVAEVVEDITEVVAVLV
jgi:hypothetical protein